MKSRISSILRDLGILYLADRIRFVLNKALYHQKNKRFMECHPDVRFPPEYLVYESYRLDYEAYFNDGSDSAKWLVDELASFTTFSHTRILDWGCGPARIVRHLPGLLDGTNEVFGTDYNEKTIAWCRQNIESVHFSKNSIDPPLQYESGFFDVVYGVSIFTHLNRESHSEWLNELYRVLKPGGLLLITTQGLAFKAILTEKEKTLFDRGELVERTKVKEGHRLFSAFQPVSFIQFLLEGRWEVLKFTPGIQQDWGAEQDTWILRKIGQA